MVPESLPAVPLERRLERPTYLDDLDDIDDEDCSGIEAYDFAAGIARYGTALFMLPTSFRRGIDPCGAGELGEFLGAIAAFGSLYYGFTHDWRIFAGMA